MTRVHSETTKLWSGLVSSRRTVPIGRREVDRQRCVPKPFSFDDLEPGGPEGRGFAVQGQFPW